MVSLPLLLRMLPLVLAAKAYSAGNCSEHDSECYFNLTITSKLTMMDKNGTQLVWPYRDKLYNVLDTSSPLTDVSDIVQADGYYQNPRIVLVANNQMPGPTIEVYQGQTVSITVKNELHSEGVTMHWHGVVQKDTNFMDGVAFVNQCPILPGQSFRYEFTVQNPGTDFYHAHIGAQRTQGLFGPLITKRKTKDRLDIDRYREYTMVLNDWNHDFDSNTAELKANGYFLSNGSRYHSARSEDNSKYSTFRWHSGLINGKGRFWNPTTRNHNNAPLENFIIRKDETVRFRVIAAGTMFPLKVSVDRHRLRMIASDGYEFDELTVDSFILSPGERFDFLVTANQDARAYWIYAETLETVDVTTGRKPNPRHRAEAILEYEEASIPDTNYDDYVTEPIDDGECTPKGVCTILNCPFGDPLPATATAHQECIPLSELNSTEHQTIKRDEDFQERFYNFAFHGGATINGRKWVHPSFSVTSQSAELADIDTKCDDCTEEESCSCTHTDVLEHNKYYQFVLINNGEGSGYAHPVHLHGHSFQVVKQGFFNGMLPEDNHFSDDIVCMSEHGNICNKARWKNESWSGKGLNSQIKDNPVLKDTVMVPSGGYTVIRFQADNPGFWFMHCHIELHNLAGMAMMFEEKGTSTNQPPASFPVCRSFPSKYGIAAAPGGEESSTTTAVPTFSLMSAILFVTYIIY